MKTELRKEYADIVEKASYQWSVAGNPAREVFEGIALACQELADRPPKELTDAEIADEVKAFKAMYASSQLEATPYELRLCRLAINAHIAKQREPETVKFRAARRKSDGYIQMVECDYVNECWEWLDADGKAQEIEVRI